MLRMKQPILTVAESVHLDNNEQQKLPQLLDKTKSLFDGTLGLWKNELVKIELKVLPPIMLKAIPYLKPMNKLSD